MLVLILETARVLGLAVAVRLMYRIAMVYRQRFVPASGAPGPSNGWGHGRHHYDDTCGGTCPAHTSTSPLHWANAVDMTDDDWLARYEQFRASMGIEAYDQLSPDYFELGESAAASVDETFVAEIMRQLTDEE